MQTGLVDVLLKYRRASTGSLLLVVRTYAMTTHDPAPWQDDDNAPSFDGFNYLGYILAPSHNYPNIIETMVEYERAKSYGEPGPHRYDPWEFGDPLPFGGS